MGHAGAFWVPGEPHTKQKIAALKNVGVSIVDHPSMIGPVLKMRFGLTSAPGGASEEGAEPEEGATYDSMDAFARAVTGGASKHKRRSYHTSARSSGHAPSRPVMPTAAVSSSQQTRSLHLDRHASRQLLEGEDKAAELQFDRYPIRYLALGVDRATRSRCLVTAVIWNEAQWRSPSEFSKMILPPYAKKGVLSLTSKDTKNVITRLMEHLQIMGKENVDYRAATGRMLRNLGKVFHEKEAKHVSLKFAMSQQGKEAFAVLDMNIELDDAAYRSGGRLKDVHEGYGALEARDPGAREAEESGIVYHMLHPEERARNIGTLSNGADLAMNTVDALTAAGGRPTNFLDTGGKATGETVKKALEIVLRDDRVKVLLVNIFGGLTLGDMIARGVVAAYEDLRVKVPVVVRVRGTNEREARKVFARSGLPLYAFDHFGEAASAAIQLANGAMPPVQVAYPEGEAEVAELKDAIQTAAETVVEQGDFAVDGAGAVVAGGVVQPAGDVAAEPVQDGNTQPQAVEQEAVEPQEQMPQESEQEPEEIKEQKPDQEEQEPEKAEGATTSQSLGSDHVA